MKPTPSPPLDRFRARLSEMAGLHLQARHLPHVRRYHAQRPRSRSRHKSRQNLGRPRLRWTLPLYMIDLSQLDSFADATTWHGGWLHFLDWGNGLLGIAELHKNGRKSVLASLSIGSAASLQHAALARFFKSNAPYQNLRCIAIPALHFRGLLYVSKTTGNVLILPLYSAIAQMQRGRRYSCETVQERLNGALTHRLQCARGHLERLSGRSRRPSTSA
jgi:hypothetical protein